MWLEHETRVTVVFRLCVCEFMCDRVSLHFQKIPPRSPAGTLCPRSTTVHLTMRARSRRRSEFVRVETSTARVGLEIRRTTTARWRRHCTKNGEQSRPRRKSSSRGFHAQFVYSTNLSDCLW